MGHQPETVRVLIADDEPDLRFVLARTIVHRLGWEVCGEAGDGTTALDLALAERPDVIVLDLVMPVRRGDEVLPVLARELPDTMVIVHANTLTEVDRERLIGLGATACYDKGWADHVAEHLPHDLTRFRAERASGGTPGSASPAG